MNGSQALQLNGMAVDGAGNAIVVGDTESSNFPTTPNALQPHIPPSTGGTFVVKVSSAGTILFATYFGGIRGTQIRAVAADHHGDIYLTGSTEALDFPTTPGAYQTNTEAQIERAFVSKLNASGSSLIYSTFVGGKNTTCAVPGVPCGNNEVGAVITTDASGNAFIAGTTSTHDFPVTAGAPQPTCQCNSASPAPFVAELNAGGSGLVFATYLGGGIIGVGPDVEFNADKVAGIAVDTHGFIYVTGTTVNAAFPVTPGAFQTHFAGDFDPTNPDVLPTSDAFVTKIDPHASSFAYSTFLGGQQQDGSNAIAVDALGRAIVSGYTNSADFPTTPGALPSGNSFIAMLSADGSALVSSTYFPFVDSTIPAMALETNGAIDVLAGNQVLGYNPAPTTLPSILGVVNAALTNQLDSAIAPGELVSLYGFFLGPTVPASFQLDATGAVPKSLQGISVLFDEIPGAMISVSANRVETIVPFGVSSRPSVTVRLQFGTAAANLGPVVVAPAMPQLFQSGAGSNGGPYAAAVNQDGTINGPNNPAVPGTIIALWGTGAGLTNPASTDGSVNQAPFAQLKLSVSVDELAPVDPTFAQPLEVLYAGAAPGLVAGVVQINVRLPNFPSNYGARILRVKVGDATAQTVAVAVPSLAPTP